MTSFDWPETRSAWKRLTIAWRDLQKARAEHRRVARGLRAVRLIAKALDIDRVEAGVMCCLVADTIRAKAAEGAAA